ncbi:MAG: type II toxin-antitoxin system RatA family toxin [Rickettsiales bacterium]|nr:type II toxin-antitoxin system RatA family toxin [Rickettsiales bacterium]
MPEVRQHKKLPYLAKDIYNLVMDIEKYPEFLPWCKHAKIIEEISVNNLHADLLINFKGFVKKYRSDIAHNFDNGVYAIDVHAISGPFKKLYNHWRITEIDEQNCDVEFYIDFEFDSKIFTALIGVIFEKANEKVMGAFEERAKDILSKK